MTSSAPLCFVKELGASTSFEFSFAAFRFTPLMEREHKLMCRLRVNRIEYMFSKSLQ